MPEQAPPRLLPTIGAFLACVQSELRARTWFSMAIAAAAAGSALLAAHIPLWTPAITMQAVIAMNVVAIAITCSVTSYSDHLTTWIRAEPMGLVAATAAVNAGRITVAAAAMSGAIAAQTSVGAWVTGADETRLFALRAIEWSMMAALTLVPWSVLARDVFGPTAGAWGLLCVVVVGSIPGDAPVLRAIRLALPALPLPGSSELQGPGPGLGAYALAHALAVTSVTALVARRYR